MPKCKWCEEKISWFTTPDHRHYPLVDDEPVYYDDLSNGQEVVTPGGNVYKKEEGRSYPNIRGFLLHRCRKSPDKSFLGVWPGDEEK